MNIIALILIIFLLPLLSFIILIGAQKFWTKTKGDYLASLLLGISFLGALILFFQQWGQVSQYIDYQWFKEGDLSLKISFFLDNLTVAMALVVIFISLLVHIFSMDYMKGDSGYVRYFAYLGLFTFSMLGIVFSGNLLLIYIFWELVGLSSYLLIGFWYKKNSASQAAKKAFIVNRVGDFGFLIGLLILFSIFGTFEIPEITAQAQSSVFSSHWFWMGLCLFGGVMGKSAQFPLQIWLPDAMEGPTPVSALIHAATMVAAGVFLLGRIFFLLPESVLFFISIIGIITAFIGGFSALAQSDIKKVLAYSTISQLGYMVMGMGVGAYEASLLHLFTHAFFKAGLFLSAGAIIHAMHHISHHLHLPFDVQNMYLMGGLRKKMPFTFAVYLIFSAALAGLPFFSGFLSKDAILTGAWAWASVQATHYGVFVYLIPITGFGVAFLTAFYMMRQIVLVFFGDLNLEKVFFEKAKNASEHLKEVSWTMRLPLLLLAILSFWFIFSLNPLDAENGWILSTLKTPDSIFFSFELILIQEQAHHLHLYTSIISVILALLGAGLGYLIYKSRRVLPTQEILGSTELYALSFKSLYFDKLYQATIAKFTLNLSEKSFHFNKSLQAPGITKFTLNLSEKSFHLDKVLQKTGAGLTVKFANLIHLFDKRVIDWIVNKFAELQVFLAHFASSTDKHIVDGSIKFLAKTGKYSGKILKNPESGQVQSYLIWAVGILVLLLWWFWA